MLFNSFEFLVFFVVVTLFFYGLPHRFRWFMLLLASCFFYMFFKPVYILILAFTIVIDYCAGIFIEQASTHDKKKQYLLLSLVANIGVLAFFKYYNFLNGNISGLSTLIGYKNHIPYLNMLLPIGLSFHTFQAMSYTIEIYRGNQKAERHFGIYALYVMFYPQLVAGPIERPQNMLHQFHEEKFFNYQNFVEGVRLMLWGLFKKVVIADRLAPFVSTVYDHPNQYHGFQTILAVFFFAMQIYCDFSGYSDIAIGAAKTMGFNLMLNFNYPYSSKNMTEFWRRWHISLSTWFNDYLFTPMVISLRNWGKGAVVFSLLVTFAVSGLWHGAGWTFIIYGLLHGAALVYEFLTQKHRNRISKKINPFLYNNVSVLLTFSFVAFSMIFFRSASIKEAIVIIANCFKLSKSQLGLYMLSKDIYNFGLCFIFLGMLILVQNLLKGRQINEALNGLPKTIRWVIYFIFVLAILNFGVFGDVPFIYFQF